MPQIALIVVIANNNAIGKDNGLLIHLPADLKHFKQLTTGHPIIMGRKTFESLPNGPLPNRKNIVVSRSLQQPDNASFFVFDSLQKAIENGRQNDDTVFIIGGGEIYNQSIEYADLLYITQIHGDFEADTFFPIIENSKWEETEREDFQPDEKNKIPYSFVTYQRKNS